MTLYISFVRAWSLKSTTNALRSQGKSQKRIFIELVVFTTIITIVNCVITELTFNFLPDLLGRPNHVIFAWCGVVIGATILVSEFILASFVLIKLRMKRNSVDREFRTSSEVDFERLVALVALVFCCSLVINLIDYVDRLHAKDELSANSNFWNHWGTISTIVNSSINLIIYLTASRNFRAAFIVFGEKVKRCIA